MPFLPLYFEQLGVHDRSAIAVWSGLSLGVTPAVTALMAPVWARVGNRVGRKLMVARALLSFAVVMVLMSFVQHAWQVFALRAALGFFAGYGPIAMTMAAESSPREHIATAIGWVQTAQRLGPALGPVIGGALAHSVGLRQSFLAAALVYLGGLLIVVFGYREVVQPFVADPPLAPQTFGALRRVPHFGLFMGLIFALQLVDRSFGPVLPLYLAGLGTVTARVPIVAGVIFTVVAGAAAIGNQLCAAMLVRMSPGTLVARASAMAAAAACVFASAAPLGWLLAGAAALGASLGVAFTAVYTVAGRDLQPSSRAVAFAYLTTASLTGMAVSPVVSGLIGSYSIRAVFLVDALGLGLVAWLVRSRMAPPAANPS